MSSLPTNTTKEISSSVSPKTITKTFKFLKKQQIQFTGKLYKEGYLLKQAKVLKTWRKRFFQLRGNKLGYYTKEVI